MPTIITDGAGNKYIPQNDGTVRRLSPEEEQALDTSPLSAFWQGGVKGTSDLANMAGIGAAAMTGNSGQVQQQQQNMAQRQQAYEPLSQMQPGPSMGGEMILNPLNLAGLGGGRAGMEGASQALAGRMSARVQQRAEQQMAQRQAQQQGQQAMQGLRSVGAAEQSPASLMASMVNAPNELNATQREIAARLALDPDDPLAIPYQTVPGQLVGGRETLTQVTTHPALIQAFEPENLANVATVERLFKQGLGVPDEAAFTSDILNLAETTYGAKYDAVRDALTPITLSDGSQELAAQGLGPISRRVLDVTGPLDGEQLFEVRRGLGDLMVKAAADGDRVAQRAVGQALDEINTAMEQQLTGEMRALLQEANGNFRIKLLLDAGQVFGKAGEVNVKTAFNYADKIYGKRFRSLGPRPGLQPAEAKLLDFIKASVAFPESFGNTGTAPRLFSLQGLMAGARAPAATLERFTVGLTGRRNADLNMAQVNPAGYAIERALNAPPPPAP